mmetsp:Transcript_19946/g.31130  ORF Transcript_19946/g.31130 Transcript_19946/m.31130 type:complete len:91 (-) Transcript_19946:104-376(-)
MICILISAANVSIQQSGSAQALLLPAAMRCGLVIWTFPPKIFILKPMIQLRARSWDRSSNQAKMDEHAFSWDEAHCNTICNMYAAMKRSI